MGAVETDACERVGGGDRVGGEVYAGMNRVSCSVMYTYLLLSSVVIVIVVTKFRRARRE